MKKTFIALVVIIVGLQFVPVDRSNPPIIQDINPPKHISEILRTSCYDCHSNETNWPWYSYVAPVSFLVTSDVTKGRKKINFSEWHKYDEKKRSKKLKGMIEAIEEGEMPLSNYLMIHPDAKLDAAKIQIMKDWVESGNINDENVSYETEDKID